MKALILTDGKAGHENQSKALARLLGCDYDLVSVRFRSKACKALSYLCDRIGWRTDRLFTVGEEVSRAYDVVIGTGSGTFYPAKVTAKKRGAKSCVVLYPRGYDIASFDCVLAPAFDRPKEAPNVVTVPANVVASDAAYYEKGVAAFLEKTGLSREELQRRPMVAVIIGGPNGCSTMSADWMKEQLDRIFAACGGHAGRVTVPNAHPIPNPVPNPDANPTPSPVPNPDANPTPSPDLNLNLQPKPFLCVTTSRRTPPEVEKVVDGYPWDYKLLYSQDHFNPIPAFVACASRLYVTAESTGMLSEACSAGTANVQVLDNLNPGPHKFRRFVDGLAQDGYVGGARKVDLSRQIARVRSLVTGHPDHGAATPLA